MPTYNTATVTHTDGSTLKFQFQAKRPSRVNYIMERVFNSPFNDIEEIEVKHRQARDEALPVLKYQGRNKGTLNGNPVRF